jgi:hypothetical protein
MRNLCDSRSGAISLVIVIGVVLVTVVTAALAVRFWPHESQQKQACSLFKEPRCPECERQTFTEVFRGCNDWYGGGLKRCTESACGSKASGFTTSVSSSVLRDMSLDSDNPIGQQKILVKYTCIKKVRDCI